VPGTDSTFLRWLSLLQHQRARGRTGLTVPFLIGAVRITDRSDAIEENEAFGALSSLLLSFRDETPEPQSIVIAECVDLHEPIVSLYPRQPGRAGCEAVPESLGVITRLYVQRQYFQRRMRTVESVISKLWQRHRDNLIRGEFSFREGRYATFNHQDRAFLDRALGRRSLDLKGPP
jgi:hypothetical protein